MGDVLQTCGWSRRELPVIRHTSVLFLVTNGVLNGISLVGVTCLCTEAWGPTPGAPASQTIGLSPSDGPSEVTAFGKGISGDQLQNQTQ